MAADFGSGIFLSAQGDVPPLWDMEVTNSGDIRTVSGENELQKDIALSTTIRLSESVGSPITPVVLNRLRGRVFDALEDDDRIAEILEVEVQQIEGRQNEVEVAARVNADVENTSDLVFEVSI